MTPHARPDTPPAPFQVADTLESVRKRCLDHTELRLSTVSVGTS